MSGRLQPPTSDAPAYTAPEQPEPRVVVRYVPRPGVREDLVEVLLSWLDAEVTPGDRERR